MLRRPPTVLTLTSEDVKAYEDHREAEAFQHATAAAHLRRQQQLSRNMSGMDITGITTSSDDEDYSEQEASYYPNRTNSQNPRISREENIEGPLDEGIYRNEEDPDDYADASDGGLAREEAFIEDQYMAEAEQMDLDAEHTDDDDDDNGIPGAAISNPQHTRRQQQQQQQQQQEPTFPSPPPAPSRLTRSTRSASTEPSSSQAQHEQQQATAARLPRGAGAAQTHRRAPSGRAAAATTAADATTPTPAAQAQRDAAERIRSRTTRSRDERIGVARGGRR